MRRRVGCGLVQVTVVALEEGQAATWTMAFAPDPTLGAMKRVNILRLGESCRMRRFLVQSRGSGCHS